MKRNPFPGKSLYLLLLFVFLFTLNACGQNSTSTEATADTSPAPSESVTENSVKPTEPVSPQTSEELSSASNDEATADNDESAAYNEAIAAYDDFLAGSADAQDPKQEISDGVVTLKDISLEPDFKTYYALFDMNGDGIPELHLRPIAGGSYAIFTYQDGKIVLWHNGPDYESPLNNGAILYERDGAAPTHINYYYLVLDSEGNEVSRVNFSKYHSVDESGMTESTDYDVFMLEDKEVSEDEWNSATKEYLSNSSDLIEWKEL
ncbi:hypothetical protein QA584_19685 [Anaerocolumna sp. AGMB13025]|uniref:hypothetical protein n=1 Tax=Anaerocolumna sp. AGMB13025 TaxID=3039116 RepID=UPI00241D06B5|nr:hypothetical protein [Anaerocolumna sp. AGMB13025]WFR55822.1 hypothetical protein QA584_19685 [Anaerocolumna sp. AGMB13025]